MTNSEGLADSLGGIDPRAGLPQPQVEQDAPMTAAFVDSSDNPHFVLAARAKEGVGFPDFLGEFAPVATALRSVPVLPSRIAKSPWSRVYDLPASS